MKIFFKIYVVLLQLVAGLNSAVEFYSFGLQNGDSALETFEIVRINFDFPFFEKLFREVHITTLGIIYFGKGSTSNSTTQIPFSESNWIATYLNAGFPSEGGDIFYREIFKGALLTDISSKIRSAFLNQNDFEASWGLVVTYNNVPRYGCSDCRQVVSHQTILVTNEYKSFVIFLYKKLDYSPALIGIFGGDFKTLYLVQNSNNMLINSTALNSSNVGLPGEWIFSIGKDMQSSCISDGFVDINPRKVAYFGNEDIHISGPCFKENDSFVNVKIGKEIIKCSVNDTIKIICRLPFLNTLGYIEVSFEYGNLSYNSFLIIYDENDDSFFSTSTEIKKANLSDNVIIKWDKNKINNQNIVIKGYELQIHFKNDDTVDKIDKFPIEYLIVENSGQWSMPSKRISKSSLNPRVVRKILVILKFSTRVSIATTLIYFYFDTGLACRAWHYLQPDETEMERIKDRSSRQNPCQPSVIGFPKFLPNSFAEDEACNPNKSCGFHEGAKTCYRSTNNAATNGIATQCCYDASGKLLTSPPGGGTLDFVDSNDNLLGHIYKDVLPYFMCCEASEEDLCHLYYEKRPIIDSFHWNQPRPVRASGDPHFTTLDGFEYDFNPIGEFVYLSTSDTEIQARISQFVSSSGQKMQASYFSSFAFRVKNSEAIQVTLNQFKTLTVTFNNTDLDQGFWNLGNYTIDFRKNNSVMIQLVTDINFAISATAEILNIIIIPSASLKGKISGLIGNWDDDINNDLKLRNGTLISINSTARIIHEYGMTWTTDPSTSLFIYPEGLRWSDYQDPYFIPLFEAPPNNEICGTDKNCQFDYYVTGNRQLAETNIIVKKEVEAIKIENQMISETCNRRIVSNAHNEYGVVNDVHKYTFSCHDGYYLIGQNRAECYKGNYSGTLGSCYKLSDSKKPSNSGSDTAVSFTIIMIFAFVNIEFGLFLFK